MFYNKNKNTTELIEFINFINENNIELLEKPSKQKNLNTELKEVKTEKTEIKTISLIENLEIKDEHLKKYNSIYQRLKDSSKVDILYIRERKKKTNDFNLIFSEIMKIREKLNLPLKRTIDVYYNERYNNIFFSYP